MADSDPIAELVRDLERDGRPSLAWVTRWSEGGGEPVAAAWSRSRDPIAMARLLCLRAHRPLRDLAAVLPVQRYWHGGFHFVDAAGNTTGELLDVPSGWGRRPRHLPSRPAVLAAVRRAVPVPPTLAELLATRERG